VYTGDKSSLPFNHPPPLKQIHVARFVAPTNQSHPTATFHRQTNTPSSPGSSAIVSHRLSTAISTLPPIRQTAHTVVTRSLLCNTNTHFRQVTTRANSIPSLQEVHDFTSKQRLHHHTTVSVASYQHEDIL
jgi:hypothetical protein